MTGRLALLAVVGELVVAIDASKVRQIRRAVDTPTHRLDNNLYGVDFDDRTFPGWDLGELFGLGQSTNAWVLVENKLDTGIHVYALRVGRCVSVRPLPSCRPLPHGLFAVRPGAIGGGFALATIPELEGVPSGVVVDVARLLTQLEIDAGRRVRRNREVAREDAIKD